MYDYLLIEYANGLNSQIYKPIQQTQRIKFNCFDVSRHFMAFGATSGGVYIYKREPCAFLKILPTKEGLITSISISKNEDYVAVASHKGLVIILENCFLSVFEIKHQVYSQHEGNTITVLKWNRNELYCGDSTGRVSVIAKNILSKSLFQVPFATLMQLDSSIVQIDSYLHYLLISTVTRTLLCDTRQEQYKQIGKKLREGYFGACFFNRSNHSAGGEQLLAERESLESDYLKDVIIFCSRPGIRLWQADFDTSVVCTHQFKTYKKHGNLLIKMADSLDCRLATTEIPTMKTDPAMIVFTNLYLLKNNLLVTLAKNIVFIFNIDSKVTILYHYECSVNIKDCKLQGNYIYIWLESGELKILSVLDLESLLLQSLSREQYLLCTDLCIQYKKELFKLLEKSDKLHLLSILETKLTELSESNLLASISDVLVVISKKLVVYKPVNEGVVFVENLHSLDNNLFNKSTIVTANIVEECKESIDPQQSRKQCINIISKQYKLNQMYNVDFPDFLGLLQDKSSLEIVDLLEVSRTNENSAKFDVWAAELFLKHIQSTKSVVVNNKTLLNYTIDSFKLLNPADSSKVCSNCKFPLPNAKANIPTMFTVFCDIFKDNTTILKELAGEIPYLWKYLLENETNETVDDLLSIIIIQFSNLDILKQHSNKFSYDLWDESIRRLIKLKNKTCLYCDCLVTFEIAETLSWPSFCNVLIGEIGPSNTIKLIRRYSKYIRNSDLGIEFYQNCISVGVLESAGNSRVKSSEIYNQKSNGEDRDKNVRECCHTDKQMISYWVIVDVCRWIYGWQ